MWVFNFGQNRRIFTHEFYLMEALYKILIAIIPKIRGQLG